MQKRQTWHLKESTSHSTATALLCALLWLSLSLLSVREANAQGTVTLSQRNALGTTHVWGPSLISPTLVWVGNGVNDTPAGTNNYAAAGMFLIGGYGATNVATGHYGYKTTFAQLLDAPGAGAPEWSLLPDGQTTTFKTGASLGSIAPIIDTLSRIPPDAAAATLEMVAWDDSSGLYPTWTQALDAWKAGLIDCGMSGAFTVTQIGGTMNPSPTILPPSFNLWLISEPSTFALAGLGAAVMLVFRRRK